MSASQAGSSQVGDGRMNGAGCLPADADAVNGGAIQIDEVLAASCYRAPGTTDDKYTRGVALLAGGSETYPGAGLLNALGAAGTGVGMIRFVSTARPSELVLSRLPECVFQGGQFQAAAIGSGWDDARLADAHELAAMAGAYRVPLVVDAGALPWFRQWHAEYPALPLVLTPHLREAAALLEVEPQEVAANQSQAAVQLAAEGAVVVLKAATTVVAAPSGKTWSFTAPSAWAGVAGAGDVLAGVLAGLIAGRQADWENRAVAYDLAKVCAAAVWIHGQAGKADRPIVASQIAAAVPAVIAGLG